MKSGKKTKTKFIATVDENKTKHVNEIAQTLKDDGVKVENVSSLFGIISGNSDESLEELKSKYESRGMTIEPNREVKI